MENSLVDPEQAAFGSLVTLEANDPALDAPLPDGTTARDRARTTLQDYVTTARANNHPLFPNLTRQANQKRTDYLTGLFTKPLADILPAPALTQLEARAAASPDPDTFRQREINRTYLSALVGRPLDGPSYELARSAFAKQHLGLDPVTTTDATFHAAIKTRLTEDTAATATTNTLRNTTFQSILQGKTPPPPDLTTLPERHRPAAQDAIADARQEAHRIRRSILPKVNAAIPLLTRAAELEKDLQPGSQATANQLILEAFRNSYPDNKADRPLYFALLAQKLQTLPEDQRGVFARAIQSTARSLNTYGEKIGDVARAIETVVAPRPGFTTEDQDLSSDFRQFQRLYQTEGAGLQKATDTFLQRGTLGVASSLPYTIAALAGPYGLTGNALAFAGESITEQRIASPTGDRNAQLGAALITGTTEAAIETALTSLGVKAMAGKLPTTFALLNRAGLTGTARAAAGGLATVAQVGAMEYTEEFLQAGTRELTAAVARDLSNLGSPYNWQGFFDSWGEAQRDIIPTVTIFALVAGGGASWSHFRQGDALRKNRLVLQAMGVPEEHIQNITTAPTPEAADALTQTAVKAAPTPENPDPLTILEARTEQDRAAAVEILRAQNALLTTAGLPRVSQSTNTFTGENEWTFNDPATGTLETFETEEAALDHWRNYALNQREEDLQRLADLAETTFLDFIQGEGTASADTDVEISTKPLRLTDIQAELATKETTTLRALDKETNPVRIRDLNETLDQIQTSRQRLDARIQAFILQHGPTAAEKIKTFFITGRRFTETTRTGLTRHVVQLFRGRTLQDTAEEFAEDFLVRGIQDGIIDPQRILTDILAFQAATGQTLLPPAYQYTEENNLPLIEAFSALSRAALLSQVRTGTLAPEIASWIELQTTIWAETTKDADKLASDLRRTAAFRQALDTGNITPDLEALIQDSIGLNNEARAKRFELQHRAQLAAEAMEGFTELADVLPGTLPHPETLRANNHPLTGEVRALWDALLKPTRRRTKTGRTVDRTNEANAFFLPIGQMEDLDLIRRRLNEQGFDFQTPADLLNSAIDSIAYGKPHYATNSILDESFSISLDRTTVTPSADTTTYPTKDGVLIGPATFSITAHHGTPHKVDRFTTEKIGTGEGAQAYGWGLYFAANEAIAKHYKNTIRPNLSPEMRENMLETGITDFNEIVKSLEDYIAKFPKWRDVYNPLLNEAKQLAAFSGNLYTVTLNVTDDQLLDWDKPLAEQSEKVREILAKIMQGFEGTGREFYEGMMYFQGRNKGDSEGKVVATNPAAASKSFADAGIRGIRFLDGNSRSQGEGSYNYVIFDEADITITAENGSPVNISSPADHRSLITDHSSFALSMGSLQRIEAAIARKLNEGPEERADFYERLRNRLAGITQRLEDTDAGLGPFGRTGTEDPALIERRRIQDAIAEARTIIDTLPPEARGRVGIDFADLTNATTEKGRTAALLRLIDKADEALETLLRDQYTEALEKLADLAKPNLQPNKQIRGRLTPEIQRTVNQALAAMALDPTEHRIQLLTAQQTIDELENENNNTPDPDPELGQKLIDATLHLHFLETFGNISSMAARQLANAYRELLTLYSTGRSQRTILDQARRQELMQARREILDSLKNITQAEWAKRTGAADTLKQRAADLASSLRFGLLSFHQAIEHILPDSLAARDFQVTIRNADRAATRAKIDAQDRFRAHLATAWNLTGVSSRRKANRILATLSRRRDDWNIEIRESNGTELIKLTEEQAAGILTGTIKPGWENDPIAIESLRQTLLDFRAQRRKAQAEEKSFTKKVIQFQKVRSRGPASFLNASDLEALYWLQLWDQEQYRPTLDKHGFTQSVIDQIRAKIDPRALDVAAFLRSEYNAEYDRLNPVFRRLYNLDLPRIRNYAPGQFENIDGSPAELDPYGNTTSGSVNAMSAGFTKSRTHHLARPKQQNALGLYWSHLESTEYFIHFAEPLRDARILFRNPDLRRRIEGIHGTAIAADWSKWLDALEVDGQFRAATTSAFQRITQTSLNTTSAVGLAYNIGTLFKQASAATGVLMELPTATAIKGLIRTIQNPSSLKHIYGTESIQQRILAGMSPEDRRLLEASKASPSLIMELLELGRLPIAYADAAFTTLAGAVAYNAHYDIATKSGMSDAQAHTAALAIMDRVVTRTAQPATTQDKSLAELSAVGFARFLFLFKSDPRQKFAITAQALANALSGKISKPEAARRILWSWALYGLLAELMGDTWQAISRDDDDPERWAAQDYLASALAGPVAGVPIIGSVLEYIVRATFGTKAFANSINPIDKAAAALITDNGLSLALLRDLTAVMNEEKPLDLTDLLTAAQQDTAKFATLAGAFDTRFAIAPAALRLARDLGGIASNSLGIVHTTEAQVIDQILAEAKLATTETRTTRVDLTDGLYTQLQKLSPQARETRLQEIARTDRTLATTLRNRIRLSSLTPQEKAIEKLPPAQRQATINQILDAIQNPARRAALTQRYQTLWPTTD